MNLDSLEKQVLGHARRQMAPTPTEALRARQAALAKVGAAAAGTSSVSGAWASLVQLKAGLIIAAIAGIGGTVTFFLRSQETPSSGEASAWPGASMKAAATVSPPPRVSADRPPPVTVPALHGPGPMRSVPTQPTPASPTTSEERRLRLAEEVRLLKQADRAIRNGQPNVARDLLEQLVTRDPKGQLLEERAATDTLIRCQGHGPEAARAAAKRFLSAYPESVYAVRIRAACTGFTFESEGSPVSGHSSSKEQR